MKPSDTPNSIEMPAPTVLDRPARRYTQAPRSDQPDRLPPHAPDAERGVIGLLILYPTEAADVCVERGVVKDWFYDPRHAVILDAVQQVLDQHKRLDMVLLVDHMSRAGTLETVGGYPYLAELMNQVVSVGFLESYLDVLESAWQARRLIRTCAEAARDAFEVEKINETVQTTCNRMIEISMGVGRDNGQPILDILPAVLDSMEKYRRGKAQITGQLVTGFEYLDKTLCGIGGEENGNVIVISGRPGMGKTSLALQIAVNCATAKENPVPVAIFSMEMNARALCFRTLFQTAGADMQRYRTGYANAEFPALAAANASLASAKMYVDDERRLTIDTLRARARRYYRNNGCRLFVVDYIQLMRSGRQAKRDDRVQELAEISAGLQAIAWELNCPFLCIAQMNRDYEKEPNRLPRLSDLKDCGAIEQDADVVMMLYNPKVKEDDKVEIALDQASIDPESKKPDWSRRYKQVHMLIAKNRYGPSDKKVEFVYRGSSTSFEDLGVWMKARGFREYAQGERPEKDKIAGDGLTKEDYINAAAEHMLGLN